MADITIGYSGSMFGYLGYRDLGSFAKSHQKLIVKKFYLTTDRVPSYSTILRAMMLVKTSDLIDAFNQWASQLTSSINLTDWVSIDGKCLRSTCQNPQNSSHNFVSIVSLFSQDRGRYDRESEWSIYCASLIETHGRKRKFMGLLKSLN